MSQVRKLRGATAAAILGVTALGSAACGASGRSDQTAVALRARHDAGRAVSGSTDRSFTTSSGERVTVTRALVVVASVELFPCQTVAQRIWRRVSPVGIALAHGVGTERRLATPNLLDVLAPDANVVELGTVHPYAGRYCWAHVTLAPADADTAGASAAGMVGATLVLEGTLTAADGTNPRPFALRTGTTKGADIFTAFPELDLEKDQVAARTLVLNYGGWLDGVDPLGTGAADQVLDRVVAAIGAEG